MDDPLDFWHGLSVGLPLGLGLWLVIWGLIRLVFGRAE